jgi:hypothetical protein
MTRPELEDAAEERLLSVALGEVAAEEPVHATASLAPAPHWLLAALVVLGTTVAIAVGVLRRDPAMAPAMPSSTPVQDPQSLPLAQRVEGRAALEALLAAAPKTRNVWAVVDPEDVNVVAEFTAMEQLVLEPRVAADGTVSSQPWHLLVLTRCLALRSVTLGNMRALDPKEIERFWALPALREFGLTGVQHMLDETLADVLHKLGPRSLKLTAVRITAPGLAAMCNLPQVEDLVLWHCLHLERCDLRQLAKLRTLRSLALNGVGGSLAAALAAENPLPGEPAQRSPAGPGLAPSEPPRALLSTALMQDLAKLPELRALDLSASVLTDDVLAALPSRLQRLGLRECVVDRQDAFARVVLPDLHALSCSVPNVFGPSTKADDFGERQAALCTLLGRQQLRELRFLGGVTSAFATSLRRQVELEVLDYHHAGNKAHIPLDAFAHLTKLCELRLVNVPASVTPEVLRPLRAVARIELQFAVPEAVASFRAVFGERVVVVPDPQ